PLYLHLCFCPTPGITPCLCSIISTSTASLSRRKCVLCQTWNRSVSKSLFKFPPVKLGDYLERLLSHTTNVFHS
ncbi:unnamed protein product, partial [Tenebrio molitor]